MSNPTTLSEAEIDSYSVRHYLELQLASESWTTVKVFDVSNGWPVYEQLFTPGIYVLVDNSASRIPFELGSNAKRRQIFIDIFGQNDAQRTRLADTIESWVRYSIPIYNYVTGNEPAPNVADEFVTDTVGWRKIPVNANTPTKERWRSLVTATVRRVVV